MALTVVTTVAAVSQIGDKSADRLRKHLTITGPASYTTGGTSFTPEELGFGQFVDKISNNVAWLTAGKTSCRLVAIDATTPTAPKLLWYGDDFNEIANGTNLSTYTLVTEFVGK